MLNEATGFKGRLSGRETMNKNEIPSAPKVIGHRGAAGHAPENTRASVRRAAELGASWVEFDVQLSRDNIPVLFHDDTLDRTTNASGPFDAKTADELSRLDAGAWFSPDFAGEPVPTLAAVFDDLEHLRLGANIELKPSPTRALETGRVVAAMVTADWPASLPSPLISSFQEDALAGFRKVAPDFDRALISFRVPRDWRKRLQRSGCVALHCLGKHLSEKRVAMIKKAGFDLRCFTINDEALGRRLLAWGVDAVISDHPERFLKF